MKDEGVEKFGGTKDVADTHKFNEQNLEDYMAAHVEGFEGPLEVRQFKGGQSNPTYQLVTPNKKYVMRNEVYQEISLKSQMILSLIHI